MMFLFHKVAMMSIYVNENDERQHLDHKKILMICLQQNTCFIQFTVELCFLILIVFVSILFNPYYNRFTVISIVFQLACGANTVRYIVIESEVRQSTTKVVILNELLYPPSSQP
jgi:hypothetical protein